MNWKLSQGKLKVRFLLAIFCHSGPNSAQLIVCSNLPPNDNALLNMTLWKVSNHMDYHSMDTGTDKHRLMTKAYSNIFKTLCYPRQENTCIWKHVCPQQGQSKVHLTQGETNITWTTLEQDLVSIKKLKYQFWKAKIYKYFKCWLT